MAWQLAVLVGLLLVALVLAKATHASALHSVTDMAAAAHRIAAGDFSRPVQARSADELGQLAQAINDLQRRLAQTLDAERQLLLDKQHINAELTAANEQLEHKVMRRTEEIHRAHEELRLAMDQVVQTEKLASLGKLVAMVSHEVNTPSGVILTAASTLHEQLKGLQALHEQGIMRRTDLADLFTKGLDATALVLRNAQRMEEVLNSFNRLRVDGTGRDSRRELFRLLDLCRDVLVLMKPASKRMGVSIELDVDASLMLDLVPGHLQQVLQNLIENSIDHAFEATDIERLIRISAVTTVALSGKHEVELNYSDTGHGLRGVDPKRLFEPFYAAQLGRGLHGLGLYIIHTLVYGSLNGSLQLDTQGPGFRIKLILPAQQPD